MPINYDVPEVVTIRTGRKYGPAAPTGPAQSAPDRPVTLTGDVTGSAQDTGGALTIPTAITGITADRVQGLQDLLAGKQGTLTAGDNITIVDNVISAEGGAFDGYDDSELREIIAGKQDALTAGENITIVDNVISAADTVYDDTEIRGIVDDNAAAIATLDDLIAQLNDDKQDRLTAGDNITINGNVISAVDTVYDDTGILDLIAGKVSAETLSDVVNTINTGINTVANGLTEETNNRMIADGVLEGLINGKQDALTAGENITINGNVISAVDTVYDDTALRGIISGVQNDFMTALVGEITARNLGDEDLGDRIYQIETKIPYQASDSNQLADKNFVNSSINAMAAHQLTYNAAGDPFPTKAALTSATTFYYKGVPFTPTEHDYVVVMADETNGGAQVRYVFNGAQWVFSYKINDAPFTSAQVAAINSNITATLTSKLSALPTAAELTTSFSGKVSTTQTINGVAYGTGNITVTAAPTAHTHVAGDITSGTFPDARIASAATWNAKFTLPSGGTSAQYINGVGALTAFPTIPAAQVNSDWNATSGLAQILNKPSIPPALSGNIALTGNVTGSAAHVAGGMSIATTIAAGAVTSAMMANMNAYTVKGNSGTAAAAPGDIAASSASTVLKRPASGGLAFGKVDLSADVTGTLPVAQGGTGLSSLTANSILRTNASGAISNIAIGSSTTTYLRNDGAWATPSGGGGGTLTGITAGTGITVTASTTSPTVALTTPVSLANGGLASTILNTTAGVLYKSSAANPGALSLATPSANTVLRGTSATAMSFGAIVNADISATAAIAVSKLAQATSNPTTTYLRGDGTWATPSASVTVPLELQTVQNTISYSARYLNIRSTNYYDGFSAGVTSTTPCGGWIQPYLGSSTIFANSTLTLCPLGGDVKVGDGTVIQSDRIYIPSMLNVGGGTNIRSTKMTTDVIGASGTSSEAVSTFFTRNEFYFMNKYNAVYNDTVNGIRLRYEPTNNRLYIEKRTSSASSTWAAATWNAAGYFS